MRDRSPMSLSPVPTAAPRLELPTSDGREFSLRDHLGRPVLVSFLSHAA